MNWLFLISTRSAVVLISIDTSILVDTYDYECKKNLTCACAETAIQEIPIKKIRPRHSLRRPSCNGDEASQ